MIELSVIIVSWNVADLLAACVQSILAAPFAPSTEIIVVDSGSTDGTAQLLTERFPDVRVLRQAENVGFTRGNNLGLREARGRLLLLLNPDTKILGDALGQMARYLDANPTVGILGPHTLNADGTTQSTRRRFPSLRLALFESTWLQRYAPKSLLDHFYCADQTDDTATYDVDWVQGSALMTRRAVYDQIGGLDERYVMTLRSLIGAVAPKMRAGAWSIWAKPRSSIMAGKAAPRPWRGHRSNFSEASCATSASFTARRLQRCSAPICCYSTCGSSGWKRPRARSAPNPSFGASAFASTGRCCVPG